MRETKTCEVCGGEGTTFEDVWREPHGHSTKHYPCTACDATGEVPCDLPEDEDDAPLTVPFVREPAPAEAARS